jgi:hypothetical protein
MRTTTQERRKKQQVRAFPFVTAPGSGVILWWYLIITRIIECLSGRRGDTSGYLRQCRGGARTGVGRGSRHTIYCESVKMQKR